MLNNLSQVEQHDYSKNIFVGKVVYNQDPLRLKRVKLSIPNLFDETDPALLPWVAPMFFGFVANGGTAGSAHLVPAVGTELVVEFQMGSPLHGLYIASPFRPDNIPAEFRDGDFQWTYGWKDPAGNLFLVNTKNGANTVKFVHGSSGAQYQVANNGDTTYSTPGNLTWDIDGNVVLNGASFVFNAPGGGFTVNSGSFDANET